MSLVSKLSVLFMVFSSVLSAYNDGIHLAIGPTCGLFNGSFSDVNNDINPANYLTIVSFGDSYTDTGGNRDGTPPPPPIVVPPDPEAGGRSSNGYMWVEDFAFDHGITVMNYAISGAVTNTSLWPSKSNVSDFIQQSTLFLSQNHDLDPEKTLYVVFFGINDFEAAQVDGDHMPEAAQTVLNIIDELTAPPTNARSFLVLDDYGLGVQSPMGDAYKQAIYSGLNARLYTNYTGSNFKAAFVDFAAMWDAIIDNDPPGYEAFGYVSNSWCLTGPCCTTVNHCPDPDHTFYWIPSHPAKEGQRIMADFVNEVLNLCPNY